MDYKYTGQDWVCVQPSVHRGTHRARSSSAAELSVSTFLLGVKKKKRKFPICFWEAVHLGRLVSDCRVQTLEPVFLWVRTKHAFDALAQEPGVS